MGLHHLPHGLQRRDIETIYLSRFTFRFLLALMRLAVHSAIYAVVVTTFF